MVTIKKNIYMSEHTTLKIGGPAKYYCEPKSENDIRLALDYAKSKGLEIYVIGNGSNILFSDKGYKGMVLKIGNKYSAIKVHGTKITVKSGAWMPYVARKAQINSLTGLEHTIGIPGNIGGIVTMNAGSKRLRIADSIEKIRVLDCNGEASYLLPEDCNFGYRESIFKKGNFFISEVTLNCKKGSKNKIRKEMIDILRNRRLKFPRKFPNCGSVYMSNAANYSNFGPPGAIIEKLGFKGFKIGGIYISSDHANFFLNNGKGTREDFEKMLEFVGSSAQRELGIKLDPEVILVG
jgi:UDP-N-acetylmuramate dehydrogenase